MALRTGAFRIGFDPDGRPPLVRPFRLPSGSRTTFSLSPFAPPRKPKFEQFKPSPFQAPKFLTPPHQSRSLRHRQAIPPKEQFTLSRDQAVALTGDKKAKAGLYWRKPVNAYANIGGMRIRLPGGHYKWIVLPSQPEVHGKPSIEQQQAQMRWQWLYNRDTYWKNWKRIWSKQRSEATRDAREEYQDRVETARRKYERAVDEAMAKYRNQRIKFDAWNAGQRAQFDE